MINMRAFLGVAVLSLLITRLRAADCLEGNCITTVLELVCILLYRFCICLEVVVFNVFQSELFPGQARATAISVISSVGMASSIAMPTMLGVMARADAHPMFMMAFFGMIGCSATGLLSETKDKEIKEEIEEMQVVSLPPNEDQR